MKILTALNGFTQLARHLVSLPPPMRRELLVRLGTTTSEVGGLNTYRVIEILAQAVDPRVVLPEARKLFLEDPSFLAWYQNHVDNVNRRSLDRKFNVRELLKLVTHVQGDFAECGVYRGATAYLLVESAAHVGNTVHLFDSFQGLSSPTRADDSHWTAGDLSAPLEDLRLNLKGLPDIWITYEGWIPSRFGDVASHQFAFVHIDVDLFDPTYNSLKFFGPRMCQGGLMVIDDYGFATCPGARNAVQQYAMESGANLIELSSGQGVIFC